ncbi:tyrosine-type recombinase/integrase [Rheinheimera oceanensis]|uniref:tyrosine-type recombinase/integrase n=1 Tax=Rheinheimera oceanensis TaxID=2817449 RepID=UPI001BFD1F09|nr:site-specific integrase [Rheinheimera oceanensis]
MSKQLERHNLSDEHYIYLQDNSKKWYTRFVLHGKWYAKATKHTDKDKAIHAAHRLFIEHQIKAENNTLTISKRFRDVAEKAIQHMETELQRGTGKAVFNDYVGVLRRYHIPFFDRTYITSVDAEKLREFDTWRINLMKKVPSKSTLLTHNAAMQMVFKEAVENKWLLPMQVPSLSTNGVSHSRRAAFTPEEYEKILETLSDMEDNSRKQVTKDIRLLAYEYSEFVIYTGMRPGTEMDNLTWGDIHIERHKSGVATFYITVRKGKTTLYTGTREVVCKKPLQQSIYRLTQMFPNRKATDLLFRLPDGSTTNEISRHFKQALQISDLEQASQGIRTLYSLRHSYITWELVAQTVPIDVLARQCGTSIEMIERHYSHAIPRMYSQQLSGVILPKKEEVEKKWQYSDSVAERWAKRYLQWEQNYKRRKCI